MSGGYRTGQPPTELAGLLADLDTINRRLDTLERPSGEQLAQTVKELAALVENIQETLDDYIANGTYNKAQIDAKIASPGAIAPTTVSASGDLSAAGNLTVAGQVRMPNVPVTILSSAYFATYASTSDGGRVGHVPSSRRFKQDEAPATISPAQVLALQAVTFRYIAAVEELGTDADRELGLIAEEVDAIGLDWLVYYDADGAPLGVRYERLALALLPLVQSHERRLATLENGLRRI
jgi:hypothetical protein